MYGSWITVLLFTVGCIVGLLALLKYKRIYYSLYVANKKKNPNRARMFKELLLNSTVETLFFFLIVVFVIVALVYEPEVSFVGY
ncbi:hypothetical protein KUL152_08260 [Tenacibaculum sp. KUL152]|nr:hypothetical protein KUL152_08260 [Tenacibaculum sp. KUL152]